MSFAIIRNTKHKLNTLNLAFRHNERRNTNYSNLDIDKTRMKENFSIKSCPVPYSKRFNQLRNDYQLKGQIKKTSNIACEYIITSDKDFFDEIGLEETKRYFKSAYKFVCNYKNLGEQYILSAKVHMDESTPHMHLVFLPVVHTKDKNGNLIEKLSCSEFWKGKNSYKNLQDNFYKYMIRSGFNLERGKSNENEHIPIKQLKVITNHEVQKFETKSIKLEKELISNDIEEVKTDYRRIIKKFNTLAKQYTRIKVINDNTLDEIEKLKQDYNELAEDYSKIKNNNSWLKHCLNKTFEYVSILFDFPINRLKNLVNDYILKENKENERIRTK
jgi:hypothetical protein